MDCERPSGGKGGRREWPPLCRWERGEVKYSRRNASNPARPRGGWGSLIKFAKEEFGVLKSRPSFEPLLLSLFEPVGLKVDMSSPAL